MPTALDAVSTVNASFPVLLVIALLLVAVWCVARAVITKASQRGKDHGVRSEDGA